MKKVTVLMSVFNDIDYLDAAINSILHQTFSEFEFLIIDDASKDGSSEVLDRYAELDSRIRLIKNNRNMGLGYCLAKGVKESKGELIARMDSDDIAVLNRLELQIKTFNEKQNLDILGGAAIDIDEKGNEIGYRRPPLEHNKIVKYIWTCPIIHPTVMFKKKSILEVGSYSADIRRRQDYELWFRAVAGRLKFSNLKEYLLYYRLTDNYYKKNNLRVQIDQMKIGLKGNRLIGSSYIAYIGVIVPVIKSLTPQCIRKPIFRLFDLIDPRK